jgi:hypothetical protein
MAFPALFAIFVGLLMILQWSFLLLTGKVSELKTEPVRITFHIVGEMVTALLLIIGGVGLWVHAGWGLFVYLIGGGMLLYTLIVSPGYYAQLRQWPFVIMFVILLLLLLVSLGIVL